MGSGACQYRWFVTGFDPGCVAAMFFEICLKLRGLCGIFRLGAEQPGHIFVELNQLLGLSLPLLGVGVQQHRAGLATQNSSQFPTNIEGISHGNIHPLPGFRAMGMAGITCYENAWDKLATLSFPYIIKTVTQPLANLIGRPPRHLFDIQDKRRKYFTGSVDQQIRCDIAVGSAFRPMKRVQLDIHAHHISAFARDDKKAAKLGRLNGRFQPYVGKICDCEHIHHAPQLARGLALELIT